MNMELSGSYNSPIWNTKGNKAMVLESIRNLSSALLFC